MTTKIPRGQTPERRAYMKAYNASHPRSDRRAYKAAYDATHRSEQLAYRNANKERISVRKAAYYRANREKILAATRIRYLLGAAAVCAYQKAYREKNLRRVKARAAAYRRANPDVKAAAESRRRAKKRGNGGSHTASERREKFARLGNVCFFCGARGRLTEDHDIPLSRGGTDDIENILPACLSCNSSKHTRTAAEFIEWRRTNHAAIGGIGAKPVQQYVWR